jgi:hypothetical protein
MRSSLFLDVTRQRFVVFDVSGQPVVPIFKGQVVAGSTVTSCDCLTLGPTVCPKRRWLTANQGFVTLQNSEDLYVTFYLLTYMHLGNYSVLLRPKEHKMAYVSDGKKSEDTLKVTLRRVVKYSSRYEIFTWKRGMFSTGTLWTSYLLPSNQIHRPRWYLESSNNCVYSNTCQKPSNIAHFGGQSH